MISVGKLLAVWVGLSVCGTGCSQVSRPEQATQGEQIGENQFLHEHLEPQAFVTVGEAYRAVLMLADGKEAYDNFAERERVLLERKIVRPEWKLTRDNAIDKGAVAYMVCRVLQIRGGVNLRFYGEFLHLADRRYAMRELEYLDLMPGAPTYRYITGAEMVDLLGNADRYMAEHGLYDEEPTDLNAVISTTDAASAQ